MTSSQDPGPTVRRSSPTVLLVHGAWHDANCWDLVTPMVRAKGFDVRALTLPSTNPGPSLPGLDDDVAAVVAALDTIDGPVVLVGHSYGGMVISGAGHHRNVAHLVYLAAFCPDQGETVLDLAIGNPPPRTADALRFHDNGTMTIEPSMAIETFYADLAPEQAHRRANALLATTAAAFTTPAPTPAWRNRPVTSVVCTGDRAISVDRVEAMATRANGEVIRWPTSHSPFLSQPHTVTQLLTDLATSISGHAN